MWQILYDQIAAPLPLHMDLLPSPALPRLTALLSALRQRQTTGSTSLARDVVRLLSYALSALPVTGVSAAGAQALLSALCERLLLADQHAYVVAGVRARTCALLRGEAAKLAPTPAGTAGAEELDAGLCEEVRVIRAARRAAAAVCAVAAAAPEGVTQDAEQDAALLERVAFSGPLRAAVADGLAELQDEIEAASMNVAALVRGRARARVGGGVWRGGQRLSGARSPSWPRVGLQTPRRETADTPTRWLLYMRPASAHLHTQLLLDPYLARPSSVAPPTVFSSRPPRPSAGPGDLSPGRGRARAG